ncbi:MAG: hypothetical protein ACKOOI_19845 [Pirellula sp.]
MATNRHAVPIVPRLRPCGTMACHVLQYALGALWWTERQWFDLQAQQLATIERIGEFPPPGCERATWQNALVSPYNVWGNATYSPRYSKISNEEMRSLQRKLEQIVAETTPDNSIESVDHVFQLLLQRGQKPNFISGYRDEFRTFGEQMQRKVGIAERARAPEPAAGSVTNGTSWPPAR